MTPKGQRDVLSADWPSTQVARNFTELSIVSLELPMGLQRLTEMSVLSTDT
tara:strand:- start:776 stop:928 length:153 start_codon:yes stop_codon:yes gene_type:complete